MPTIEVSEAAFEYLKGYAEPLKDTSVTVLDRILEQHKKLVSHGVSSKSVELHFSGPNLPSVKFASVLSASIDGTPTKESWNHILEDLISACVARGAVPIDLRSMLKANTLDGRHSESGYRYVSKAGFSFQGLEANRVCKNLAVLAEAYSVPLDIKIRWQETEKAAFPGETARLVLP